MSTAIRKGHREAGILLHPTSLPSGQLDRDAYRWLDLLAGMGVTVWQMLPLGLPLTGLSPYQCASAFALNPALFPTDPPRPSAAKPAEGEGGDEATWLAQNQGWVNDFALFMELKNQFGGAEWVHWPLEYRQRDTTSLAAFRTAHAEAIAARIHQQFTYWQQWQQMRAYAKQRGIRLFGDMPIFVAHDSADVWAHPEYFRLDADGQPTFVTGVPPDYFSETGQRWGNPHYDWDRMRVDNFHWWRERLRYHFDCFDLVRIDHFRGLEAAWTIPASCPTAIEGEWQPVPGDELLSALQTEGDKLSLVAEDLGIITPEVTALRLKYQLPGMSVLQFAFDHFADNPHKPWNVVENTVYYTGTHDNDTLHGWFNTLNSQQQGDILALLGSQSPLNAGNITILMLETVLASSAGLVMIPWQDILELGSEARMNIPGTIEGNWQWRFQWAQVADTMTTGLHRLLATHKRLHQNATTANIE